MNELDNIFEQLVVKEAVSEGKLSDALREIDVQKARCADLSRENGALKQDAFRLLKNLYRSYDKRESAFDSGGASHE